MLMPFTKPLQSAPFHKVLMHLYIKGRPACVSASERIPCKLWGLAASPGELSDLRLTLL
jgi:hypothetical protein